MTNDKYTIKVNTDYGSACFPAFESDEGNNFILLDNGAYEALERFSDESGIKYPELVSECILSAINEGGDIDGAWIKENEDDFGGFSFVLIERS